MSAADIQIYKAGWDIPEQIKGAHSVLQDTEWEEKGKHCLIKK